MIQRIQSLYQLAGIATLTLGLFLPWSQYSAEGVEFSLTGINASAIGAPITLLTVAVFIGIFLAIWMFLAYKSRSLQLKLGSITMFQMILTIMAFALVHSQAIDLVKAQAKEFELSYGFGLVTPLICMVLIWTAKRAIKKDEELVKSVDRLR